MDTRITTALLITTIAGLSTAIGGLLGITRVKLGSRAMSMTLGFAAGVMIFVAFVELLKAGIDSTGFLGANLAFFAGIAVMFAIDILVPHEYFSEHYGTACDPKLLRTGILCAVGLTIHNFPEGLATFVGALKDVHLGLAIGVAIAIHNIPEGLAVAVPIARATGSRKKAFWYAFFSGMAEPAGAVVAALVLYHFLNDALLGWLMGGVAGLMVYVALDELVPASREYGHDHIAIMSAAGGMAVMSTSLWLFKLM